MLAQLVICKRLFHEALPFVQRNDAFSSGLAISLLQDACELAVWALIKAKEVPINDQSAFTKNVETLQSKGFRLSAVPQVLELNKARVNFKHYGNLPAPEEAAKFMLYASDFLSGLMLEHFGVVFSTLSLVDLITEDEARQYLREAEVAIARGDLVKATLNIAIAKNVVLAVLPVILPTVSEGLNDVDRTVNELGVAESAVFSYLQRYLEKLRGATLAALIKLPLSDFHFLENEFPSARKSWRKDEEWYLVGNNGYDLRPDQCPSAMQCTAAIKCLVDLSLRLDSFLTPPERSKAGSIPARSKLLRFKVQSRYRRG